MSSENTSVAHGALVRQWQWPLRTAFWWAVIGAGVWAWAVGSQVYWASRRELPTEQAMTEVLKADGDAMARLRPALVEPGTVALAIHSAIYDHVLLAVVQFSRALMAWPAAFKAIAEGRPVPPDPGGRFVAHQLQDPSPHWVILVTGTRVFAVRTAMYLSAVPTLLLAAAVGLVDGLVSRARRKANAGRESASIYHRAKLGMSFLLISAYLVWLGMPTLPAPAPALLALSIAAALLLRTQVAFYKKYL